MEQILFKHTFDTQAEKKTLDIVSGNILDLSFPINVLVCSAFIQNYIPTKSSLIGKLLYQKGISVEKLAQNPLIDMKQIGVWLSQNLDKQNINHIACVEMSDWYNPLLYQKGNKDSFTFSYSGLFLMLRMAALQGIKIDTIALPLLGTGNQQMSLDYSITALLTECRNAIETIDQIKHISIVIYEQEKIDYVISKVEKFFNNTSKYAVFISYSHQDTEYAELLAQELISQGVKVWIDSHRLKADKFAGVIVDAIENSEMFTILVSKNAMNSKHVLQELIHAFECDTKNIQILPIRLDSEKYTNNFSYYLKGNHFETAIIDPKNIYIKDIADKIINNLKDLAFQE